MKKQLVLTNGKAHKYTFEEIQELKRDFETYVNIKNDIWIQEHDGKSSWRDMSLIDDVINYFNERDIIIYGK